MWEYDCCLCQKQHNESEPEYELHVMRQSKHGARFVPVEAAIIRAAAIARMECREAKAAN